MIDGDATTKDAKDVLESLNGDGYAYARLVERHQAAVASRMWRFSRDKVHHQELVHDVFVQAFLSLRTYRGKAPFQHWIVRIATNVGYRFWKDRAKDRAKQTVPLEEWDQLPLEDPDAMDPERAADLLDAVLDRLPPRDRLVLMLRYVENLSIEETAEHTGWTQTMVKVQAWRARKKLKALFQEAGLEVE
jgi:RNA polymerase sigma-70 factor, ECF subfamily